MAWNTSTPTVTLMNPNNAAPAKCARPETTPVARSSTAQPMVAAGIETRHHFPNTMPARSKVGITHRGYSDGRDVGTVKAR